MPISNKEFDHQFKLLQEELDYDFLNICIEKKGYDNTTPHLNEKAMIFLYSTDEGEDLNNRIRTGEESDLLNWFKNCLEYALVEIKKCDSYRDIYTDTLYRGSKINYDGIAEVKEGEIFINNSFLSTSCNSIVGRAFIRGVFVTIETKNAVFISQYAENEDEQEVLCNVNMSFNVIMKEEKDEILYLWLEDIDLNNE